MNFTTFFHWLEDTSIGTALREGLTAFPLIECVHVVAVCVVMGTIAIVDMRLLGWRSRDQSITEVMDAVLPWTRRAFVLAVISGVLLFSSNAVGYVTKAPFIAKMILLVVAMANVVAFHRLIAKYATHRHATQWSAATTPPVTVRAAGGLSLVIWIAVIACGRWTGFV